MCITAAHSQLKRTDTQLNRHNGDWARPAARPPVGPGWGTHVRDARQGRTSGTPVRDARQGRAAWRLTSRGDVTNTTGDLGRHDNMPPAARPAASPGARFSCRPSQPWIMQRFSPLFGRNYMLDCDGIGGHVCRVFLFLGGEGGWGGVELTAVLHSMRGKTPTLTMPPWRRTTRGGL